MKKIVFSSMFVFCLLLTSFTPFGFAASDDSTSTKEKLIEETKAFILESRQDKLSILSNLPKDSSEDDVVSALDEYAEKNQIMLGANEEEFNFDLVELFPELSLVEAKSSPTINLAEYIQEQKAINPDSVFEFNDGAVTTSVHLDETGQVSITFATNSTSPLTLNSDSEISPMWTGKSGTNGMIIYGLNNYKLVRLWVSGNFLYNGNDVKVNYSDGGSEKYAAGSLVKVTMQASGKARTVYTGSYKYAEAYTRAYLSSGISFKFGSLIYASGTFETYTGSTVGGSIYGASVKR